MDTEKIWAEFNKSLYKYIKKRINDPSDAEDLLQDVFIKIHRNSDSIENIENIIPWIYRITKNSITDYYRKRKFNYIQFNDSLISNFKNANSENSKDISICLNSFIEILPQRYKEIIELSDVKGFKNKETANILNLSLSAAKTRIRRGREMLKQHFIDCCKFKTDNQGKLIGGQWPNENCNSCKICTV